jgi:hypothetical protein
VVVAEVLVAADEEGAGRRGVDALDRVVPEDEVPGADALGVAVAVDVAAVGVLGQGDPEAAGGALDGDRVVLDGEAVELPAHRDALDAGVAVGGAADLVDGVPADGEARDVGAAAAGPGVDPVRAGGVLDGEAQDGHVGEGRAPGRGVQVDGGVGLGAG